MARPVIDIEYVENLRVENLILREMLEDAEIGIHGEYGTEDREPYDWEPCLAERVAELKAQWCPRSR